jgi:hypothetical protein
MVQQEDYRGYLTKLLVGQDSPIFPSIWQGTAQQRKQIRRLRSPCSEDAVTWNFFETLRKTGNLGAFFRSESLVPKRSSLIVKDAQQLKVFFWDRDPDTGELWDEFDEMRRRIEKGPIFTEPDCIILTNTALIVIESKLTAEWGTCSRMIRLNDAKTKCYCPTPAKCGYWSEQRTSTRIYGGEYIPRLFDTTRFRFENKDRLDLRRRESKSDCFRFYQLMRNYIIGHEVAESLDGRTFYMVCIVNGKTPEPNNPCREPPELNCLCREFEEFCSKLRDSSPMRLTTWQAIGDAVSLTSHKSAPIERLLTYIDSHPLL